jgi:hypothetical protein
LRRPGIGSTGLYWGGDDGDGGKSRLGGSLGLTSLALGVTGPVGLPGLLGSGDDLLAVFLVLDLLLGMSEEGEDYLGFGGDEVGSGVGVPVVGEATDRAGPTTDGEVLDGGILMATTRAGLGRGKEATGLDEQGTPVLGPGLDHREQGGPAGIGDRPGQMVILEQVDGGQVLGAEYGISRDQGGRDLAVEGASGLGDLVVFAGQGGFLLLLTMALGWESERGEGWFPATGGGSRLTPGVKE